MSATLFSQHLLLSPPHARSPFTRCQGLDSLSSSSSSSSSSSPSLASSAFLHGKRPLPSDSLHQPKRMALSTFSSSSSSSTPSSSSPSSLSSCLIPASSSSSSSSSSSLAFASPLCHAFLKRLPLSPPHRSSSSSAASRISSSFVSSSSPPSAFSSYLSSSSSSSPSSSVLSLPSVHFFAHMDDHDDDPSMTYGKAMIAGAVAGATEHAFMFPIDTIKTRMQALTPQNVQSYAGFLTSLVRIVREEGGLRLYRGVSAAVLGAIPSHAVNYAVYEYFKAKFGGNTQGHHFAGNAAAGILATAAHDAIITPLDVVKQRLQVVNSPYAGVWQCMKTTLKQEGVMAFYASYPTTLLMNVPFMSMHFAGYESFKLLLTGQERADKPTIVEELIAGGAAGAGAGFVSTPLDVVKTRIQTQLPEIAGASAHSAANSSVASAARIGALDVCRLIYSESGWRGFTRGATARILYNMPSAAICWTTYETTKRFLKDAW